MVNGVLYTTAGTRRAVVALDAATGEMLWMHREDEGKRGDSAPRRLSGRGLAYWTDGRESRIVSLDLPHDSRVRRVAISGNGYSGELVAFTAPQKSATASSR